MTEQKLQELMRERLELVTAIDSTSSKVAADRQTSVVAFPSSTPRGSDSKSSKGGGDGEVEGDEQRGDGRLLFQALARNKGGVSSEEGPPLTTKAMRDLSALEKERIYEYTLIRIRWKLTVRKHSTHLLVQQKPSVFCLWSC